MDSTGSAIVLYRGQPERRMGPQGYDPDAIMPGVLERVRRGESIRQIARSAGMPDESVLREWGETHAVWSPQYARARELGWSGIGEELLEIADDSRNDWMDRERENGTVERVIDREAIDRTRIRLDTRKWLLAKMLPKIYGDRLTVDGMQVNVIVACGGMGGRVAGE